MEFIKRILLLSVIALLGGGNLALAQQQNNDFRTGPVTDPIGDRQSRHGRQAIVIDNSGAKNQPNNQDDPNNDANTVTINVDSISDDTGTAGDFNTTDNKLIYNGTIAGWTPNGDAVLLELKDSTGSVVGSTMVTPSSTGAWTWDNTAVPERVSRSCVNPWRADVCVWAWCRQTFTINIR